jgi:hypothetical protein
MDHVGEARTLLVYKDAAPGDGTGGAAMQAITGDFIRTLAAANGIDLPDERVELVRREYDTLLRTLATLDSLPLTRETEPALGPSLSPTRDA